MKNDYYQGQTPLVFKVVFSVVISLIVMLMLVTVFGKILIMFLLQKAYEGLQESDCRSSYSYVAKRTSPELKKLQRIYQDSSNFDFKWTLEDMLKVKVRDVSGYPSGHVMEQVLEGHGKATEITSPTSREVDVVYWSEKNSNGDSSYLKFNFIKNGSQYYLGGLYATYYSPVYPSLKKGYQAYNWIVDDLSKLTVKDDVQSQPGTSYSELVQEFGLPQQSFVSISRPGDRTRDSCQLVLRYHSEDSAYPHDKLELKFDYQEDGSFRLTAIDSRITRTSR